MISQQSMPQTIFIPTGVDGGGGDEKFQRHSLTEEGRGEGLHRTNGEGKEELAVQVGCRNLLQRDHFTGMLVDHAGSLDNHFGNMRTHPPAWERGICTGARKGGATNTHKR